MASILDMMKQEEQKNNFAERMEEIFSVQDSSRIRFLHDFHQGIGIYWHKNFNDDSGSVSAPCLKQFGLECAYCFADEKKTKRNTPVYCFAVYDYDKEKPLILLGRDHEKTIVGKVKGYWAKKKSILGRDFYVDKSGEKLATTYNVAPEDPTTFEFGDKYRVAPDRIEALQECMRRAVVMAHDPATAEELGYSADDKLAAFFAGQRKTQQRVRQPVKQTTVQENVEFDE